MCYCLYQIKKENVHKLREGGMEINTVRNNYEKNLFI